MTMEKEILYKDRNGEYTLDDVLQAVKANNKRTHKISKLIICKRTIPGITESAFCLEEQFILGTSDNFWAKTQVFDGAHGFSSFYELNIAYENTDKVVKTLSQNNITFEVIDLFQTHRHIFE